MSRNEEKHSLDRLFKERVEDPDIPFREEDWLDLRGQLEVRELKRTYTRNLQWLAVASLLILALLGYFVFENRSRIDDVSRQVAGESAPELLPVPDGILDRSSPLSNGEVGGLERGDERGAGSMDDPIVSSLGRAGVDSDVSGRAQTDTGGDETQQYSIESGSMDRFMTLSASDLPDQQRSRLDSVWMDGWIADRGIWVLDAEFLEGTPFDERDSSTMSMDALTDRSRTFSLGLVLAPDLSMAGTMPGFGSPGLKAGVTMDWELGAGFALQTGVIYSGVRYSGDGRLYNPAGYTYGSTSGPESLRAVCHLLDIPVTLRLQLYEGDRSQIVAGTGISSYIMLNEQYRFSYAQYSPGQLQEWRGATGTRHWASHVNLSVGYELSVVPGWSLRAEPYLRLPIRDVGWANVKLYSIGSLFSLNVDL